MDYGGLSGSTASKKETIEDFAREQDIQANLGDKNDSNRPKGSSWRNAVSVQGSVDTGRITLTFRDPGVATELELAEGLHALTWEYFRQRNPKLFKKIERWHQKRVDNGEASNLAVYDFARKITIAYLRSETAIRNRFSGLESTNAVPPYAQGVLL